MASNNTVFLDDGGRPVPPDFSSGTIEAQDSEAPSGPGESPVASRAQREAGDQVNRFLLCALVNESAKSIKAGAEKIGESLPMTTIIRCVLRSYRQAAKDLYGPLANPEPGMAGLKDLNERIMRDEITRNLQDKVKDGKLRLARAKRAGDDSRIKVEEDNLGQAIQLRDRLAKQSL